MIADAIRLVSTAPPASNGLFYVHNNHLGTPEVITDQSQTVSWKASYTPYGEATITTNTITNNIRLPGQYFDSETGLHYNYFRYYDPSTGRYVTSDPIGLQGGINTYGYVEGNPTKFVDPLGLRPVVCPSELGFPAGAMCDDGKNPDMTPRCVTAECAAGLHPLPPKPSAEAMCNFSCNVKPQVVCTGAAVGAGIYTTPLGGAAVGVGCVVVKATVCSFICDDDKDKPQQCDN